MCALINKRHFRCSDEKTYESTWAVYSLCVDPESKGYSKRVTL